MKATYIQTASCQSCIDLGWYDVEICRHCKTDRTHAVEVLQLGVGLFGNKATVKDLHSGKLMTVNISELTVIEEETNET